MHAPSLQCNAIPHWTACRVGEMIADGSTDATDRARDASRLSKSMLERGVQAEAMTLDDYRRSLKERHQQQCGKFRPGNRLILPTAIKLPLAHHGCGWGRASVGNAAAGEITRPISFVVTELIKNVVATNSPYPRPPGPPPAAKPYQSPRAGGWPPEHFRATRQ